MSNLPVLPLYSLCCHILIPSTALPCMHTSSFQHCMIKLVIDLQCFHVCVNIGYVAVLVATLDSYKPFNKLRLRLTIMQELAVNS